MVRYEGGCLCGELRYAAEAEPVNARVCHCRLCQKAVGAAFNARILFRRSDLALTGAVQTFHSSPEAQRGFCPSCGTTVFSLREGVGVIAVTAGSLDDPSQFKPSMHIWISSKQPWLQIDDGLPQFPEGAPVP